MFLKFFWSGEQLQAARTSVLGRQTQIVGGSDVRFQVVLPVKRRRTFGARRRRRVGCSTAADVHRVGPHSRRSDGVPPVASRRRISGASTGQVVGSGARVVSVGMMHVVSQRVDVRKSERTLGTEDNRRRRRQSRHQVTTTTDRRRPAEMDGLFVVSLSLGVVELHRTEATEPTGLGQRAAVRRRRALPAERRRRRYGRRARRRVRMFARPQPGQVNRLSDGRACAVRMCDVSGPSESKSLRWQYGHSRSTTSSSASSIFGCRRFTFRHVGSSPPE